MVLGVLPSPPMMAWGSSIELYVVWNYPQTYRFRVGMCHMWIPPKAIAYRHINIDTYVTMYIYLFVLCVCLLYP